MLPTTPADLDRFLTEQEGPNFECKEARTEFSSKKLRRYLCALSNEGGGHLVLGVTDQPPRQVIGSQAFPNAYADLANVQQDLRPPPFVDARVVQHPDGRVLVFEVGPRPMGRVVRYDRQPWARLGESLVGMRDEELRRVLLETHDATDERCERATLEDLDPEAILLFRAGVVAKARDRASAARYASMDATTLLRDVRLMRPDGTLRKAALLLLGAEDAIDEWVPNAEVIAEYRSEPGATRYDDRVTARKAILLALDELWETIRPYVMLRPIEVQQGTQVTREPRFAERSVREAMLNAIAHRDYNDPESVIVRMSPETFEVTSPGPFPATITPDNIADEQFRRNRRLAEALEKCGRIERSGQGVDLMIEAAVRRAQPLPTFEEPDGRSVRVTLHGTVDMNILPTLQRVPSEVWDRLGASDLQALDAVRRRVPRGEVPRESVRRLIEQGIVEPGGTGDSPLAYSQGLRDDGPTGDAFGPVLLDVVARLKDAPHGTRFVTLRDALEADPEEVRRVLQWLRRNGLAYTTGRTRGTRWHYRERD